VRRGRQAHLPRRGMLANARRRDDGRTEDLGKGVGGEKYFSNNAIS
jgi:hypothetical protein